jgi:hypothetical protein
MAHLEAPAEQVDVELECVGMGPRTSGVDHRIARTMGDELDIARHPGSPFPI